MLCISNCTPLPHSVFSKRPRYLKRSIAQAARYGYPAIALLDRDGVYGAPRFHRAATAAGIKAIIGAELTIELTNRSNPTNPTNPTNPYEPHASVCQFWSNRQRAIRICAA